MRGIVLAGGLGTRLHPLTLVTNKSLLPAFDRPTIFWSIKTLVDAGIDDVMIVCGGNSSGEFLRVLGNGEAFGLKRLNYAYQAEPKGIAHALSLAREWADDASIAVILSDNFFQDNFTSYVQAFTNSNAEANIFVTTTQHPEWYGVVELGQQMSIGCYNIIDIVEKPKHPKSNFIATGMYFYRSIVWELIDQLTPSARQELEITDLNNLFKNRNTLFAHKLNGYWGDLGESIDVYNEVCRNIGILIKEKAI